MATISAPLDFSALIASRTAHFSGRHWVFARINQWLADPTSPRVFHLAGGPGTGKTAIAARLAQVSEGTVTVPGCDRLQTGFLTHLHFCQAGLDSTLSPITFVQALSEALANALPVFRTALEEQASQQIVMKPVVNTGPVAGGARVAGLIVDTVQIEIHSDDARSMFDVAVRRPLMAHAAAHPDRGAVILVDSLDEALTFSRERSIAHLLQLVNDFPLHVRFIVTARSNNQRVGELVGTPSLDLILDAPPGVDEVRTYAAARLAAFPAQRRNDLAAAIASKSQGNFLFAYHVLNDVLAAPERDTSSFEIPDELEGVYRAFLKRELAATGEQWNERFLPLLGTIAVARGDALTKAHLEGITGLTPAAIDGVLRICREYLVGGDPGHPGLRIYHYSFQEFLLTDTTYSVYPGDRHAAIGAYFLGVHGKSWRKCQDGYALRYTPFHLAEAARSTAAPEPLIRSLVELTGNPNFQQQCETVLGDVRLLQDHLELALAAATVSGSDDSLPWIARAWNALAAVRRKFQTGASVIALARSGAIAQAEGRLALFGDRDRDWRIAASAIMAWLAHDAQPASSRDAIAALAPSAVTPPLRLLLDRVRAGQNGDSVFPVEAQPAEPPEVGRELVRRLSGQTFDAELLLSRGIEISASPQQTTELVDDRGFAVAGDAPILINSAREYGAEATAIVDAYIDAHAGYNYVEYRNRSLWFLLEAVLRHHPDQGWVRDRLARILEATLAAGGAGFTEMAPIAATALVQRLQPGGATPIIDAVHTAARGAIGTLQTTRGANDSWSIHRRRLTMLMELETLVRRDAVAASNIFAAIQALERDRFLEGFAGFRAPAELRLADGLLLCGLPRSDVDRRILMALKIAHHIQDYHFCARITARCAAMTKWHQAPLPAAGLVATIRRFVSAPLDVEFAAEHAVGEPFPFRHESDLATGWSYRPLVPDDQMLPIAEATNADTLERLADVFQRPALEFVRLNPGLGLGAAIPPGTRIHVPDPGLAPVLASHLAARVVADTSLGFDRIRLIRSLLPLAAANETAIDTVLAYLLIVSDPEDSGVLQDLVGQLGQPVLASATGSAPAAAEIGLPS